jgi:hypothetical protein
VPAAGRVGTGERQRNPARGKKLSLDAHAAGVGGILAPADRRRGEPLQFAISAVVSSVVRRFGNRTSSLFFPHDVPKSAHSMLRNPRFTRLT